MHSLSSLLFHLLLLRLSHASYVLVASDEFDGSQLDTSFWQYEVDCFGGWNDEAECYTSSPSNSWVSSGILNINAKMESTPICMNNNCKSVSSARLLSKKTYNFGKFEARIKAPLGQYVWPAFWLIKTSSLCPNSYAEIDILEAIGVEPNSVFQTSWFSQGSSSDPVSDEHTSTINIHDWHTYAVIWDVYGLTYFIDGVQTFQTPISKIGAMANCASQTVFSAGQTQMQVILNLAIGGNMFGANQKPNAAQILADSPSWTPMLVDYVRIYQWSDTPVISSSSAPVPTPTCSLVANTDYQGQDIANVARSSADQCCAACSNTAGCVVAVWTATNGGTCWLKNGYANQIYNPLAKATIPSNGGKCSLNANTDYKGQDIANVARSSADQCCAACSSTSGCVVSVWTNYKGGTCWLKSGTANRVYKLGAQATVPSDGGQCFLNANTDYKGQDIADVPRSSADQCCSVCSSTSGCVVSVWTNYKGGTCWLKSGTANRFYSLGAQATIRSQGSSSSQVPSVSSLSCIGIGAYESTPNIANWCANNCLIGNCPSDACSCIDLNSGFAVGGDTNATYPDPSSPNAAASRSIFPFVLALLVVLLFVF